jgi:nitrile hydratase
MDGIHDLGGKEGFGPIEVQEPAESFHEAWEGRMWAIAQSTDAPDWTIDWWRHVRELIDPVDYLTRPYFDQWAQTQLAAFIDSGLFTLEEGISGRLTSAGTAPPPALTPEEAVAKDVSAATRFDRATESPAAFAVGARVRTEKFGKSHHTRLPAYARDRTGVIHAHHGAHLLPDAGAQGKHEAEHLYAVVFEAEELWPEARGRRDRVFLDLWESYLESA